VAAESLWLSVAGSVVSATAALAGVAITQRATRRREQTARVWGKRADTYVRLMRWLVSTERRLAAIPPTSTPRADQAAELLPDDEVAAEAAAYASSGVEREFETCARLLRGWADPALRDLAATAHVAHPDGAAAARAALDDALHRLRDGIRRELAGRRP
jgi:hypothetical protein